MDIASIVQRICIVFPALLIALVLHEYAHAWMAKRYGDMTSAWSGRLTLNPIAHMDLFGTLIFPLIGIAFGGFIFGWAKPVPIDPRQFTNFRRGLFWVAFAGPLANIILGFLFAFVFVLFYQFVPTTLPLVEPFREILRTLVLLNFVLAIFNLLPIPPLDGSKMLQSFLSYEGMRKYESIQQYGFFILLFLLFSGALRFILTPIHFLSDLAISLAVSVVGSVL